MTSDPWGGNHPTQPQDAPPAMTPTAMTPTAMTPTAMTPTALTPTAMNPTAMTPTALTPTVEPGEAGQPGRALGPNYALIGYALLLVAGSGAVIWQLVGLPRIELSRLGPGALVVGGLGLVLIGQLGLLRRRRIERRAAAARSITPPTSR